jgi:alkylation response protein AidB-like acyl-CoA dehydrogenase
LRATLGRHGWRLDGESPWVSGWGRVDVLHTAARADDGSLVWLFVDPAERDGLGTERLNLAALNATATVRATF